MGTAEPPHPTYLTSAGDTEQAETLGISHWKQLSSMFGISQLRVCVSHRAGFGYPGKRRS
jgi:hypothetical protein